MIIFFGLQTTILNFVSGLWGWNGEIAIYRPGLFLYTMIISHLVDYFSVLVSSPAILFHSRIWLRLLTPVDSVS